MNHLGVLLTVNSNVFNIVFINSKSNTINMSFFLDTHIIPPLGNSVLQAEQD